MQQEPHFEHRSRLTWVVLREALQGLWRVHTNIIFGEDDLAIQAWAQRCAPRPRVEGQEVGGLGGGTPQEPTQRHLLRHRDPGPILWGFGSRRGSFRQRRVLEMARECLRTGKDKGAGHKKKIRLKCQFDTTLHNVTAQILSNTSAPLSHMCLHWLQRPYCRIPSQAPLAATKANAFTESVSWCVTKRVPPSAKNTHTYTILCTHTQRHVQTHFTAAVWNSKQLSVADRCRQHQRWSMSHHQCLTCPPQRETASCDETNFKSSEKWSSSFDACCSVLSSLERGSHYSGSKNTVKPSHRSHWFISFIASSRTSISVSVDPFQV